MPHSYDLPLAGKETLLLNGVVPESTAAKSPPRSPWAWIPTLYLAEGLPYVVVTSVSVVLYKNLGVSNGDIAFYTGLLSLPWAIKPLWSPVVDLLRTRRLWIWPMQLLAGAGFAAVAMTVPTPHFFQWTLAIFYLLAFASATHDIAADGFYMLALTEHDQSWFVGIRNTFYRVAMICGQGGLIWLEAQWQKRTGNAASAWSLAFTVLVGLFIPLAVYHSFILPRPESDRSGGNVPARVFFKEFGQTFGAFFRKPKIVVLLLFLLLYRLGEAQLVKMTQPFLLDPRSQGGLGLSNEQLSFVYGTVGVAALLLGGLTGGFVVSRNGLKAWLWPMVFTMHLPDTAFLYLASVQPTNFSVICGCVAAEQFGYGFGFAAYMLYMIYIARGPHATAHYAICTGFMALGLMLPGMWSGRLQEWLGYPHFFAWVLLATIPGFIMTALIPLDSDFGKKRVTSS